MEASKTIQTLLERSDEDTGELNNCTDIGVQEFMILNADNVLKKIEDFGNIGDLCKLRLVSETFYEMLNSTFLDIISPWACFSNIVLTPGGETKWKAESYFHGTNDNLSPPIEIPLEQLLTYKHIFQGICLKNHSKLNLEMIEICCQFHPYITKLELQLLPFPKLDDWTLLKFINQFKNLRELFLKSEGENSPFATNHVMQIPLNELEILLENLEGEPSIFATNHVLQIPLDELETLLDNLEAKPIISMYLSSRREEILAKFGLKPNMKFTVSFTELLRHTDCLGVLQEFKNILTRFKNLTNLKFDCTSLQNFFLFSGNRVISNIADLQTLTTLWTQQGDTRTNIALDLGIELTSQRFPDENEVKECLIRLSPFIARLLIYQTDDFLDGTQGVVSMNCDWPRLVLLNITGYKNSLEILKHCPKLSLLRIVNLDYGLSIFSNKDQSMEESLYECFGNLSELEILTISPFVDVLNDTSETIPEKNTIKINGLDEYFKGLFPKLRSYKNLNPSIFYYRGEPMVLTD